VCWRWQMDGAARLAVRGVGKVHGGMGAGGCCCCDCDCGAAGAGVSRRVKQRPVDVSRGVLADQAAVGRGEGRIEVGCGAVNR
jgi:hypothetical protein